MTIHAWKQWTRDLKAEIHALYLAYKDRRTPWYAKAIVICVVGYALSPIDLIPDAIPILGYLDDMIIVPVGLLLARRLIPPAVMIDCRQQVKSAGNAPRPNAVAAGVIIVLWIASAAFLCCWLYRVFR